MALKSSLSASAYDIKEIVYTNLMLLGFCQNEAESKFKIPFSKEMFDLPNRKGMEVIFHFLFHRMDASLAKQELRDCWPILDKKQEQGFRKACSNWLTGLAKEPLANMPRINASTLMAPGGERFYVLLLQLTTYAIRNAIQSDFHSTTAQFVPIPPAANNKLPAPYEKVLQARAVLHRQQFLEKTKRLDSLRQHWSLYAIGLTDRHRELSKRLRVLEERINKAEASQHARLTANLSQVSGISRETLKTACQVHGPQQVDARAHVRNHNVNQLRKLRSQLETYLSCHSHSCDVLDAVMQRSKTGQGPISLTSEAATFDLPESTLRDMPAALQSQLRHQQATSDGDVVLGSLNRTCQEGIAHLLAAAKKGGLPNLTSAVSHFTTLVDLHREQLSSVKVLRSQLANEYTPGLEVAVQAARDKIKRGIGTPCKALPTFVPQLDLMAASPGLQFSLDATGSSGGAGQQFDSPALVGFHADRAAGSVPRTRDNAGSIPSAATRSSFSDQPFTQPRRYDISPVAATTSSRPQAESSQAESWYGAPKSPSSSSQAEGWHGALKSSPARSVTRTTGHSVFSPRKAPVSLASALSDLQQTGVPATTAAARTTAAMATKATAIGSTARTSSGQVTAIGPTARGSPGQAPAVEDSILNQWQDRLRQLRQGQGLGQRAAAVSPSLGGDASADPAVGSRYSPVMTTTTMTPSQSALAAAAQSSSGSGVPGSGGAWTSLLDDDEFLLAANVFPAAADSSLLFDQPLDESDVAAGWSASNPSSATAHRRARTDSCEKSGVDAGSPLHRHPVVSAMQFASSPAPPPPGRSTPPTAFSAAGVPPAGMSTPPGRCTPPSIATTSIPTAGMSTPPGRCTPPSIATTSVPPAGMSTPSTTSLPAAGEQLHTKLQQWQERLERLQLADSTAGRPAATAGAFSMAPLPPVSPAAPAAAAAAEAHARSYARSPTAMLSSAGVGSAAADESALRGSTPTRSAAGRSEPHTPLGFGFRSHDASLLSSPLLLPESPLLLPESPLLLPESLDAASDEDTPPGHALGDADLPATPTNDHGRFDSGGGSQARHDILHFSAVQATLPLQSGATPSFKSMQYALAEFSPLWPADQLGDDDDDQA